MAKDIDINMISKKAHLTNKIVYVFLHKNDCTYCESMISFTLDDDQVHSHIEKNFLFVNINIDDAHTIKYKDFLGNAKNFAKHIDYNFYPSSVFIDGDNKIIYGQPGYQDENDFIITLNYVSSHAYKTVDIEDYKIK